MGDADGSNLAAWALARLPCSLLQVRLWAFSPIRKLNIHVYYMYLFFALKSWVFQGIPRHTPNAASDPKVSVTLLVFSVLIFILLL